MYNPNSSTQWRLIGGEVWQSLGTILTKGSNIYEYYTGGSIFSLFCGQCNVSLRDAEGIVFIEGENSKTWFHADDAPDVEYR